MELYAKSEPWMTENAFIKMRKFRLKLHFNLIFALSTPKSDSETAFPPFLIFSFDLNDRIEISESKLAESVICPSLARVSANVCIDMHGKEWYSLVKLRLD